MPRFIRMILNYIHTKLSDKDASLGSRLRFIGFIALAANSLICGVSFLITGEFPVAPVFSAIIPVAVGTVMDIHSSPVCQEKNEPADLNDT